MILGNRQSLYRSEEDVFADWVPCRILGRADELMLVCAGLPIEDLDDRILLAGDEQVVRGLIDRDSLTSMEVCVAARFHFLELPCLIHFTVGVEANYVIAVGINGIDSPFRVAGDAAELLESLFAEASSFELKIVRAKRFALIIQRARLRRHEGISEIESLIGDQNHVVGLDCDVDDLTSEYLVAELAEPGTVFDVPDLDAAVAGIGGEKQTGGRECNPIRFIKVGS